MKKSDVTNVTHQLLVTMSALLFLVSVYALLRTGVYAVSEAFRLLPLDRLIEGIIIRILDTIREFVLSMYAKQAFSELAVLLLAVSVMVVLRIILSYRKKEGTHAGNITPGTS